MRGFGAGGFDHLLKHASIWELGRAGERIERTAHALLVARGLEVRKPFELRLDRLARRGPQRLALLGFLRRHAILVDTDNGLDTSVNLPLEGQRRVAANLLRNAGFD